MGGSTQTSSGVTLMGPKDYVRTTGKPVLVTDRFARGAAAGPFVLILKNGGTHGQYERVSSATIALNGVTVVSPSDFNQSVALIEKTVSLIDSNTLTVELRSKPGSGFTLWILGRSVNASVPVAAAGPDQSAPVGTMVTLDGSGSRDQDGDALTFTWSLTTRPPASGAIVSDATAVKPTFVVDAPGTYVAQLVVSDAATSSTPDTVVISTVNSAPVADAGPDQTAFLGTEVTLDGSRSHDVDGNPLSYRWSLVAVPTGSTARLVGDTDARPRLVIDLPGIFVAQLIVNDGIADSAADTVVISTLNSPPVADAGPDQTVLVLTDVTLDASASRDVDGDALTYRWTLTSRPESSTATLIGDTNVRPTFVVDAAGTYVAQVIVNDGTVNGAPDTVVISTLNSPPVADAGPDQTAFVGTDVTLDGSRSRDVDGNPLTFRWTLTTRPIGSAAVLSAETDVRPTFVIDEPGTYVAQLMVHDGTVDSAPDTVVITTLNSAPVAEAGPDQAVFVGTSVLLNGGSSGDVDGDALTFRWALTGRPAGSAATLVNETTVTPSLFVDEPGTYVAQLIVNDGRADSTPDTVTISTENSTPVANAGPDQAVTAGETVALDGRASSDADADPLTFRWSLTMRPEGSAAGFDFATSAQPTFIADLAGTYVAQLIVNDGTVDSTPDTVVITAATANTPPIADAGGDRTVARGATVQLNGSASSDPEGSALTYAWTLLTRPAGSAAVLANASTATPTFTADVNGDYIVQLVVSDGRLESAPNTVTITVRDGADLRVTFFGVPVAPPVGSFIGLRVTLTNLGPTAITGATVSFRVPTGYTIESVTVSPGDSYDGATGTWTIAPLGPPFSRNLNFGLRVNQTGPYDPTASITGSSHPDPNPVNNTVTMVVTPNPNADLSISFNPFNTPFGTLAYGANASLIVDARNDGPARAFDVTAHVQIPPGYTIAGAFVPGLGSFDTATGILTIGTLSAFGRASVFLTLTVNTAPGPLNLSATIAGSQPDPNPRQQHRDGSAREPTADSQRGTRSDRRNRHAGAPRRPCSRPIPTVMHSPSSGTSRCARRAAPHHHRRDHRDGILHPRSARRLPGPDQADRQSRSDRCGRDTLTITATGLSRAPIILSGPVTTGAVGPAVSLRRRGHRSRRRRHADVLADRCPGGYDDRLNDRRDPVDPHRSPGRSAERRRARAGSARPVRRAGLCSAGVVGRESGACRVGRCLRGPSR